MDSEAITVMSLDCQYKLTLGEHLDKTLHLSPVSICGII